MRSQSPGAAVVSVQIIEFTVMLSIIVTTILFSVAMTYRITVQCSQYQTGIGLLYSFILSSLLYGRWYLSPTRSGARGAMVPARSLRVCNLQSSVSVQGGLTAGLCPLLSAHRLSDILRGDDWVVSAKHVHLIELENSDALPSVTAFLQTRL